MSITSVPFAVFSVLAILVYWLLPARFRRLWLWIVSLAFVVTWSWGLAAILLVTGTVNLYLGKGLGASGSRPRRILLYTGIIFNIFVLAALKYEKFFLPALVQVLARLGLGAGPGSLQVIVPVGLSFVILQMISYLVDVSRQQMAPVKSWWDFSLYVLYFPKFLSGPIERAKTFVPRLAEVPRPGYDKIVRALGLIFIGVIRKRLFADMLNAMIPADAFVHPLNYSASILLTWLLGYAFALYNDFAGYSSIVRGVSALFGIELTNNFNVPYLSRTFSEFWNRWHISLSNWLRDYIFFPLSRFMRLKIPAQGQWLTMIIPPVITMCASGLWHGISVNLLLWGAIHGSFLAFERVTRLKGPNVPPDELPRLRQVIGTVVVFLGVLLAWLPFRMDFVTAKRFLAVMILPAHWMPPNWVMLNKVLAGQVPLGNVYDWNIPDPRILLTLIPAIFLDVIQNRQKDELMFLKWPRWAQITACVLMILGLGFMAFSDTLAPFVYQGF